uniref:Uncharacterized protein n=1 Tax=Ditylenchus dipsaci TaxID=166011 RepID=A0A915EVU7_9BILA
MMIKFKGKKLLEKISVWETSKLVPEDIHNFVNLASSLYCLHKLSQSNELEKLSQISVLRNGTKLSLKAESPILSPDRSKTNETNDKMDIEYKHEGKVETWCSTVKLESEKKTKQDLVRGELQVKASAPWDVLKSVQGRLSSAVQHSKTKENVDSRSDEDKTIHSVTDSSMLKASVDPGHTAIVKCEKLYFQCDQTYVAVVGVEGSVDVDLGISKTPSVTLLTVKDSIVNILNELDKLDTIKGYEEQLKDYKTLKAGMNGRVNDQKFLFDDSRVLRTATWCDALKFEMEKVTAYSEQKKISNVEFLTEVQLREKFEKGVSSI